MKKSGFFLCVWLILLFTVSCKKGDTPPKKKLNKSGIKWSDDIDKSLEFAKKNNKIIMVDAYTDWCSWCKKLDEETYSDKDVIDESKKFVNIKINPETSERANEFLADFNVSGYPTILFLDADLQLIDTIGGFIEAPQFLERMKGIILLKDKLKLLYDEYKNENFTNSAELLEVYLKSQRFDEALPVFTKLEEKELIPQDKKAFIYSAIGNYYGQQSDFPKAKEYFEKLINYEEIEVKYSSIYYYSLAMLLNEESKEAIKFLNSVIKDKKTPDEWKSHYKQLLDDYSQNNQ